MDIHFNAINIDEEVAFSFYASQILGAPDYVKIQRMPRAALDEAEAEVRTTGTTDFVFDVFEMDKATFPVTLMPKAVKLYLDDDHRIRQQLGPRPSKSEMRTALRLRQAAHRKGLGLATEDELRELFFQLAKSEIVPGPSWWG